MTSSTDKGLKKRAIAYSKNVNKSPFVKIQTKGYQDDNIVVHRNIVGWAEIIYYPVTFFVIIAIIMIPLMAELDEANDTIETMAYEHEEKYKIYEETIETMFDAITSYDSTHIDYFEINDRLLYDTEGLGKQIIHMSVEDIDYHRTINRFFDNRKEFFDNAPSIYPIMRSDFKRLTSLYGPRVSPFLAQNANAGVGGQEIDRSFTTHHDGIDIATTRRAYIIATADGSVTDHWVRNGGHPIYGHAVKIDHGNGFDTFYAHMRRSNNVYEGKEVKRGDVIGFVGNTGLSFGDHLHYEIHYDGEPIDPIRFLRSYYGEENTGTSVDLASN